MDDGEAVRQQEVRGLRLEVRVLGRLIQTSNLQPQTSGYKFMVICNDQLNTAFAHHFRGLDGGDAAVNGDDELRTVIADLGDRFAVQAVPFFDAVRDVIFDNAAELADGVPEDGGGGDAVDVVIAVDDDFFVVANRFGDSLGGEGEIGDQGGIVQAPERGAKEIFAIAWIGNPAIQ